MKKLLLLFLCTDILLLGMGEEESELSRKEPVTQRATPSLAELSLKVLLEQDAKTSGHKLHNLGGILSHVLSRNFGTRQPEWGVDRLLAYAKKAEALGVKSEVEKTAELLAEHFDFESDDGFGSVEAKVKLFNALGTSPSTVRDAITTKRATMPLKKRSKFK